MEWQPIESAPKDGSAVLLFSPDGDVGIGIIETVDYGDGPRVRGRSAAWAGQRSYEDSPSVWLGGYNPIDATHWMPLPAPPEA